MIQFNSDIKELIQPINNPNIITQKVINYILENEITALGFYSLLDNNGIYNVQSLKKSLLSLFIDIKDEIIKKHHYLKEEHIEDLKILKQLFQINNKELLYYKSQEINEIISEQLEYLANTKEITKYRNNLHSLFGLSVNTSTYHLEKEKTSNTTKMELVL